MPLTRIDEPSNARSRRTRTALLAAARAILEENGFAALTMRAVAERAGVTRAAAYMHFDSRAALVSALFDYVAEVEGLSASLQRVRDAPDAVTALDRWASHLARYHPRLLAVDRAVRQVRRDDPDAATHRERVDAAKLANCRDLARCLAQEGRLAEPWTAASAADMLYGLVSSDLIESLLTDRRWSAQRLARHLAVLFRATFVRGDAGPAARPGAAGRPAGTR